MALTAKSDDPRTGYQKERGRIREAVEAGEITEATGEAITELLDALDPERPDLTFTHNGDRTEASTSTLIAYGLRLRTAAKQAGGDLLELSTDDAAGLMTALRDGCEVRPEGYSNSSLKVFGSALRAFYRYHDGLDVDPEAVVIPSSDPPKIDERDLWTADEVEAMRREIDSKRDEALFELLAYTGQRIRVIQTIRVKDADPDKGDTGRYWVNETVDGRKNREGHGPLLGAQGAVRRWLRVHPTGEPDDALFTVTEPQKWGEGDDEVVYPGEPLSQVSIRRIIKKYAEKAGVEKKVNPHMFRHYFTTIAKKPKSRGGFGMDSEYIKRLRGDSKGSNVMETTYSHLEDEDAAAHAEDAFTGAEPDPNALTPAAPCGTCGEMLRAGDKACSNCGAKRSPDAEENEVEQLRAKIERLENEREAQRGLGALEAFAPDGADLSGLTEGENNEAFLNELADRVAERLASN